MPSRFFDGHVLFGMQADEASELLAESVRSDIFSIQSAIISQIHESFPAQFIPQFVYQSLLSELVNLNSPIQSVLQLIARDASSSYPRFFRRSSSRGQASQEQSTEELARGYRSIFDPIEPEPADPEEDREDEFLFLSLSFSEILSILGLSLFANQTPSQLWIALAASRSTYVRNRLNAVYGQVAAQGDPQATRQALIRETKRTISGDRGLKPYRESVARVSDFAIRSVTLAAVNAVTTRIAINAGIKRFIWSAILDGITCLRCLSLNGESFPVVNVVIRGPQIPLHMLCRCLYVPIARSAAESAARPPKRMRDINITFPEWLKSLPEKTQVAVLGKKRRSLFLSGRLTLNSFLEFRKRVPIRIKPLNELRGAA